MLKYRSSNKDLARVMLEADVLYYTTVLDLVSSFHGEEAIVVTETKYRLDEAKKVLRAYNNYQSVIKGVDYEKEEVVNEEV